ncbi:hypothetical protein MYCTH_2111533 [Thermothelomyces thermophilus ATCC 42464]|uniref:Heme haloperoxidase family profile domain-containing protein n=1 Tax=Thermothelomyces thermophilus (strain ATCC 42464 / BCRC 31852 / DSM 1799) TaxID=573729 RepID=G2QG10_THET4|nr:uncharacterized protein MYCTH_2111533 [Thermothelomyces thermophilus ATCC 42464]AEO59323.1 hypothetical protein MYCTH_2111533 [Thermothelomyces thermophilus ATCC 42464]
MGMLIPYTVRGPCPMINTLANHEILPRDGRGITKDVVIRAMKQGLDFDLALAVIMFDQALIRAETERLPTELGWRVRDEVVRVEAILRISDMIGEATSLLTRDPGGGPAANVTRRTPLRRGFHASVRLEE